MDANIITTVASAIGILVGVSAIVGRSEDRLNRRIDELSRNMDGRFGGVNTRFDDMKDLWRAELHRVEGVLDARLKHMEEK